MGKRTPIDEFSPQNRGGKGVLCYKITEKTGDIVGVKLVHEDHDIMIITTGGVVIRISVDDISVIGRNTSGVKLMNIDADSDIKVASIAKVRDDGNKSEGDGIEELHLEEEIDTDAEAADLQDTDTEKIAEEYPEETDDSQTEE